MKGIDLGEGHELNRPLPVITSDLKETVVNALLKYEGHFINRALIEEMSREAQIAADRWSAVTIGAEIYKVVVYEPDEGTASAGVLNIAFTKL